MRLLHLITSSIFQVESWKVQVNQAIMCRLKGLFCLSNVKRADMLPVTYVAQRPVQNK